MNGLLLVRTNRLRIWNNDFSFNSGLGIGMYRSSDNVVMHNRADYCIRGYVHGVYNRGQDSAALLIYEQSLRNTVAYNSMTHGGDGLFLWAGQSTMDSGQGGANDNLFFGNDFSFAATNGIEATFSRNRFVGNLIEGAHHGMWGGYSFQSEVRGNVFRRNTVGVAIEHGQDNAIVANRFEANQTAVRLWWNPTEPSDWGYPKHRDTRSRDYRIAGNTFTGDRVALRVENTQRVVASANGFAGVDTAIVAVGDTTGWSSQTADRRPAARLEGARWVPPRDAAAPAPFPDGQRLFPRSRRGSAERPAPGRQTILVDEWGPFDWRSPRLWPARPADSSYRGGPLAMVVVGPTGRWRLIDVVGATVAPRAGRVGDTVTVTPTAGGVVDWRVELEYRGQRTAAPNGAVTEANQPFRFGAERFVAPLAWAVRVFTWDSAADPRRDSVAFRKILDGIPQVERTDPVLDYLWYRPRLPGFPAERFAVVAETKTELPDGRFAGLVISDDAVRVWLDDRLVVDRWEPHESTVDQFPIGPGRHRLKVEYYQVGGWVELRVAIGRVPPD